MKYLKKFNQASEYEAFKVGDEYITPNVSWVVESDDVMFEPFELKADVICVLNVTDETLTDFLIYEASNCTSIILDGTELDVRSTMSYTFKSTGKHIVGYNLNDKVIANSMLRSFKSVVEIIIGDEITEIKASAFKQCVNLQKITIGKNVSKMAGTIFENCTNLKEIISLAPIAPQTSTSSFSIFKYMNAYNGVLKIPYGSSNYLSLWMSSSNSGYLGYYNWTYEIIDYEPPVYELDYNNLIMTYKVTTSTSDTKLLYDISNLEKTMIVDGKEVPLSKTYLFDCEGLHTVEFKLTDNSKLASKLFYDLGRPYACSIPSTVTNIGDYVFYWNSSLTEITCHAVTAPTLGSSVFTSAKTGGILKHPKDSDYSSWSSKLPSNWTLEEF